MSTKFGTILVTYPTIKEARRISDKLLYDKLVACANIIGLSESKFWWRGKVESQKEVLVIMKARKSAFRLIDRVVRSLHTYEVPEIVMIGLEAGSKNYLKWLDESTR